MIKFDSFCFARGHWSDQTKRQTYCKYEGFVITIYIYILFPLLPSENYKCLLKNDGWKTILFLLKWSLSKGHLFVFRGVFLGIIDTAAQELPSIMMRKGVAVYFHWGWCEVEAVIQSYAQTVGQRRVLEHMCKFLVHLGKSWAAARKAGQQQTFPVQDVVGQSVAILQVPDLLQSRIYAVTTCMAAARAAGSADFCINFRLVENPGWKNSWIFSETTSRFNPLIHWSNDHANCSRTDALHMSRKQC